MGPKKEKRQTKKSNKTAKAVGNKNENYKWSNIDKIGKLNRNKI